MRLWSLHPSYLDSKGLVALWREGLLAQKVLLGKTKAYQNHPEILRFRKHRDPVTAIGTYLVFVHKEAQKRGYGFDVTKIFKYELNVEKLSLTRQQLTFELKHLSEKLRKRAPEKLKENKYKTLDELHPLFSLEETLA